MADFALSPQQSSFRDLARRFAQEEIAPTAAHYDQTAEFPWPIAEKAYKAGLLNLHIPEQYGGSDLSIFEGVLIREELAAACSGITSALMISTLASTPLLIAGSEEQKHTFLSPLCEAARFASFAMTEPGAGSDVAGITTSAHREGNDYILNGTKRFITGAGVATWFVVFAKTDGTQG